MTVQIRDLDKVLKHLNATERLESSVTIANPVLSKKDAQTYTRAGLGNWLLIVLRFRDFPSVFLGAPEGDESAGVSIWYKARSRLTPNAVAEAVKTRLGDDDAQFLDPETGADVAPSEADLAEYRGKTERLRMKPKGVRTRVISERGSKQGMRAGPKSSSAG